MMKVPNFVRLFFLVLVVFSINTVCLSINGSVTEAVAKNYNYIDKSEAAIGGISIRLTEDYVRSIYGNPDRTEHKKYSAFGPCDIWYYGDSFVVEFGNKEAFSITISGNNGLKTPAGFMVGSKMKDVLDYFGYKNLSYQYRLMSSLLSVIV